MGRFDGLQMLRDPRSKCGRGRRRRADFRDHTGQELIRPLWVSSTSETPSTNSFLALLQELNSKKEKAEEMIQFLPEFGPHTHLKWGVPAAPVLRRQRLEDSRGL